MTVRERCELPEALRGMMIDHMPNNFTGIVISNGATPGRLREASDRLSDVPGTERWGMRHSIRGAGLGCMEIARVRTENMARCSFSNIR